MIIGNINDVCYFVLEMFVIMENTSDVRFYILCSLIIDYI